MSNRWIVCVLAVVCSAPAACQSTSAARRDTGVALVAGPEALNPSASAEELEKRADELRAQKDYFGALEYYRAALAKKPDSAVLCNKIGINELMALRLRSAWGFFERAIKLDPRYAAAYNNLGVVDYAQKKYSRAIKQYEKAIRLEKDDASFYSNLGATYFSKKQWEKSAFAYNHAVALDPDVFNTSGRAGIAGQIASPEDRAHFSFFLAKLYAKNGLTDRSLECLRRAMEEGYKGVNAVYSDAAFSELRKDPRFVQLMSAPPVVIPE